MVHGDWTGEVHSEEDIQQRSLSVAANLLCTHFATFENLVGFANFSGTRRTVTPVGYGSVMVHMAWGHLQGAIVHLAKTDGGKGFGLDRSVGKMLNHVSDSMSKADREN